MKPTYRLPVACLAAVVLASCATAPSEQDNFSIADANRDDKLSRKEVSDVAVQTIFTRFDSNHDGKLTFHEWQENDKTANKLLFAERDTNSDGHISLNEARASADRQKFLQDLITKTDRDGDDLMNRAEAAEYAKKNDIPAR